MLIARYCSAPGFDSASRDLASALLVICLSCAGGTKPDPNAYLANITGEQGDYDLTVSSWQPDFPSANGNISPLFDTSQIGGGGYNLSRYSNPRVDQMIAQATGEVDQVKAQQDWAAADQRIMKDAPVVPLLFTRNAFLRGSDVENFDVSGFPNYPNYLRISLANG